MPALDMQTVIVGNMIINAVCLVVMLQLWRQNRSKYAGLNYWVVDWALQFGGCCTDCPSRRSAQLGIHGSEQRHDSRRHSGSLLRLAALRREEEHHTGSLLYIGGIRRVHPGPQLLHLC